MCDITELDAGIPYVHIQSTDYLHPGTDRFQDKFAAICATLNLTHPWSKIMLLTTPRVGFKTFNPASFFMCYEGETLHSVIVEVTNTYHEKHLYVLSPLGQNQSFKLDKDFHVSPFFDEDGSYQFSFQTTAKNIHIGITYTRDKTTLFYADIQASMTRLTRQNYLTTILKYPLTALLTFPRIVYQAIQLYYKKKLQAKSKPKATSPMTIRHQPLSFIDKIFQKIVFHYLKKCTKSALRIVMPDGTSHTFGDAKPPIAEIRIANNWIFRRLALSGEIGLGESYFEGYWDSDSVPDVIEFFILNRDILSSSIDGKWIFPAINACLHRKNKNSLTKSKKNIASHYDLSNDMYDLFLDPLKIYSSGIFLEPDTSLDEAQQEKMRRIIEKAQLSATDHVLEIGSGWGALAIMMAKTTGCRVTTITLSEDQFREVQALIITENLQDQVTILLQDFRTITGQFSRIVSVEMLEAVGHDFLADYFKQLDKLLTPQGHAVLQVISFPDFGYDIYRKSSDFIRKHIFQGGHLPSLSALCNNMAKHTTLIVEQIDNIGPHYAPTLAHWRQRFLDRSEEIKALGFDDEFIRKFCYYFSFCEAAFRVQFLMNYQLTLSRVCRVAV